MKDIQLAAMSLLAALLLPATGWTADAEQQTLFHIERSKNDNIVQYDALVDEDGRLNKRKPVVAYWIRPHKEDRIKQLSWIQRTFAYGFKAKLSKDRHSVTLDMVADIGRPIHVNFIDGAYRASIVIDGEESHIEKMYIHSVGSGTSTSVEYIDLHGSGVESGGAHYERITP